MLRFAAWQVAIVLGAIVAYFGVRGLTEGDPAAANRNAARVLDAEHALGIAIEQPIQHAITFSAWAMTLANWVYIWMHWPIVIGTLIWLIRTNRLEYLQLRNAIIISGLIGLMIFVSFPVAPPRLFSPEFVDTVTERSYSYRVLQPPAFVNRYAAMPSLHFGWNLLVGIVWYRVARSRGMKVAAVLMPAAMAWAVVATANHWVLDVLIGGTVALTGLLLESLRHTLMSARIGTFGPRHMIGGATPSTASAASARPYVRGRTSSTVSRRVGSGHDVRPWPLQNPSPTVDTGDEGLFLPGPDAYIEHLEHIAQADLTSKTPG